MDVRLRRVTVRFPHRTAPALDAVDLHLPIGSRVALIGPSGSGKSTLLRTILGATPALGAVRVDGLDPYGGRRERMGIRRRTGLIRQGGDLVLGVSGRLNALAATSPTWTVPDWFTVMRGAVPPRFRPALEQLTRRHRIEDCLESRVETLSGGQRQRVALVRALLPGPELLLADEPTGGLDPVTGAAVTEALLHSSARTILVATHDLGVARRFPRVLALQSGRIVHDGTLPADAVPLVYGS